MRPTLVIPQKGDGQLKPQCIRFSYRKCRQHSGRGQEWPRPTVGAETELWNVERKNSHFGPMGRSQRSSLTLCSHARWTAAVLPNQTPRMSQIQQTLTASAPPDAQRGRQNPRVGSRTRPPEVGVSAYSWIFSRITREASLVVLAIFSFASALVAQPYTPPANERVDVILDPGWRFIRQDVTGAQNSNYDDSAWSVINLPHTWNNLDGQNGGSDYYRGIGWYRVHCAVDGSYTNRHFFLKFDGAFSVTDVYLNGNYLGEHQGGFAAFVFDITFAECCGAERWGGWGGCVVFFVFLVSAHILFKGGGKNFHSGKGQQ